MSTIANPPGTISLGRIPGQPTIFGQQQPTGGTAPSLPSEGLLPGGDAPGAFLCGLAGLGQGCSWADLAAAGAGLIINGGGGNGGSEPAGPGPGKELNLNGGVGGCAEGCFRVPGTNRCACPEAMMPGGEPGFPVAGFSPTLGMYGAGVTPVERQTRRRVCPPGHVLGKDNVCYDRLPRSRRKWDPGMKPLMTGGDRAAIRKAARAGRKLARARKGLRRSSRDLGKAC